MTRGSAGAGGQAGRVPEGTGVAELEQGQSVSVSVSVLPSHHIPELFEEPYFKKGFFFCSDLYFCQVS